MKIQRNSDGERFINSKDVYEDDGKYVYFTLYDGDFKIMLADAVTNGSEEHIDISKDYSIINDNQDIIDKIEELKKNCDTSEEDDSYDMTEKAGALGAYNTILQLLKEGNDE